MTSRICSYHTFATRAVTADVQQSLFDIESTCRNKDVFPAQIRAGFLAHAITLVTATINVSPSYALTYCTFIGYFNFQTCDHPGQRIGNGCLMLSGSQCLITSNYKWKQKIHWQSKVLWPLICSIIPWPKICSLTVAPLWLRAVAPAWTFFVQLNQENAAQVSAVEQCSNITPCDVLVCLLVHEDFPQSIL